jgi:hypothetical protein
MAEQLYRCSRCKEYKPASCFQVCSRRSNKRLLNSNCKKCKYEYEKSPAGRAAKLRYQSSKKYLITRKEYYNKSESNRKLQARTAKRLSLIYPEIFKARGAIHWRIQHGTIVRPVTCSMQNDRCNGPIEAHHHDYNKPLDVVWVCRHHHRKIHNRLSNYEKAEMAAMDRQEAQDSGEGGSK